MTAEESFWAVNAYNSSGKQIAKRPGRELSKARGIVLHVMIKSNSHIVPHTESTNPILVISRFSVSEAWCDTSTLNPTAGPPGRYMAIGRTSSARPFPASRTGIAMA